jgi:hypothetical protein
LGIKREIHRHDVGQGGGRVMDIYDGAEWTEMDIDYLKAAIAAGRSIEEAAPTRAAMVPTCTSP